MRTRHDKLWRMYEIGQERIDEEFDIVSIIKSVRNLNIFLKSKMRDHDTRFMIESSRKHLLMLDTLDLPDISTDSNHEDISPPEPIQAVESPINQPIQELKELE